MKQRVRKLFEYTWADRLGYAVVGTPNLLEYDQGFFVKGGDGLADVKPIARLYKSQVYVLARELGLPEAIAERAPTTETFSLPQTQEEFYFGHPYERMDVLLWGYEHDIEPEELSDRAGLEPADVEIAYRGDRAPARRDRVPPRSSDRRRRARADDVRARGDRPSGRRGAGRRGGPAAHGRGRSATAARTASDSPSTPGAGLVSARLAIFDLPRGWQPLEAARGGAILVYNGEVYNHPELRAELAARGERFDTTCDTEVVLRLLEREGVAALDRLNGQFAFAWWQPARAPADARPRPLRRAAALLRPARRRDARLRLRGEGAVRLRRGGRRAATSSASTRSSPSGARARRGRYSPGSARSGPAGSSSGSAGAIVERADVVDAGVPAPASAPRRGSGASSCATASGCACAPTSRSGPTSPEGSTRA